MEMSICQAENRFSLDDLVKKLADAFENKVFSANSWFCSDPNNAGGCFNSSE
jgi:hypothetical protein